MTHLRAPQVAAKFGWSMSTFYNRIRKGEFPPGLKLGPRLVVWPEDVVDAWLAEKRKTQEQQLSRIVAGLQGPSSGGK